MSFWIGLCIVASAGSFARALPAPTFHEMNRYVLGGEGGWDYLTVDSTTHKLYIARGQRVMIVDTTTGKLEKELTGTDGVHGIALDLPAGLGFTSNGKSSTVTVFDLKTLKVVNQIPVGQNPDAIMYDTFSKNVFSFNGKSQDTSVISVADRKVVAQIPLGGKPEFAVGDGKGNVFVNLEDQGLLVKINTKTLKVAAKYPLKPCEEPTGLAIDTTGERLFVGCGNKLMAIVRADNGQVVKTFPVGDGVDAVAFDEKRKLIFVSAGEGRLSVVHQSSVDNYELVQDLKTQKGARTLAVDAVSGKVFLVSAGFGPTPKADAQGHARPPILPDSFVLIVVGAQ